MKIYKWFIARKGVSSFLTDELSIDSKKRILIADAKVFPLEQIEYWAFSDQYTDELCRKRKHPHDELRKEMKKVMK